MHLVAADVYSPAISSPRWESPTSPTEVIGRIVVADRAEALEEFEILRLALVVEMFLVL